MNKIWKIELTECFSGSEIWCEAENIEEAIEKYKKQTKLPIERVTGITLVSSGPILR